MFIVLYNVSGAAISAGGATVFDVGTSTDGVRVSVPATATLGVLAGVAAEAIADSAYGKVQVYGFNSAAYVIASTDVVITSGSILVPVNATSYLAYSTQNTAASILAAGVGKVHAFETVATMTTPAAATKKVFVQTL